MDLSIVKYSKARKANKAFRFDAEYFKPSYSETENLIKKKEHTKLGDIISDLTDYHANGSYAILRSYVNLLREPDYAYMIRTVDLERDDFDNDLVYIDKRAYDFLNKTKAFGGEIIINKIGNAGRVYIIPHLKRKTSLGMNQFMLRATKNINNNYLYAYLACTYGQNQLQQRITGTVPLSIDKESVRSVLVPLFSAKFQMGISNLIKEHFALNTCSKDNFKKANKILLSELRLLRWKPKHNLFFIKPYSKAKIKERFDAEYFQPKYDKFVKSVKDYLGRWDALGNLVTIKKCIEVGSDEYLHKGIPFIRVSNLSPYGLAEEKFISDSLYDEISEHNPKKGEILLSKDATPGIAYHFGNEPKKMIPSAGILRLKIKDKRVNEEYLTIVLNSLITKEQINRDVGGSVILHWRLDHIKNTLIPILSKSRQLKIKQIIVKARQLREKSNYLIECAKKAIDIAIEKNELTAMKWLQDGLKK